MVKNNWDSMIRVLMHIKAIFKKVLIIGLTSIILIGIYFCNKNPTINPGTNGMVETNDTLIIKYIGFVNTYDNTGLVDSSSLGQAGIDAIRSTWGWGFDVYYYEDSLFLFQDSFLIHFSDTLGGGYFHGRYDTNYQRLDITAASRGGEITPIDSFSIGIMDLGWKPYVCYKEKSGPFYFAYCYSFAKTTMDTAIYPTLQFASFSVPQQPSEPCEPMFLSTGWYSSVTDSLRGALGPSDTLRIWQWFKQFE